MVRKIFTVQGGNGPSVFDPNVWVVPLSTASQHVTKHFLKPVVRLDGTALKEMSQSSFPSGVCSVSLYLWPWESEY